MTQRYAVFFLHTYGIYILHALCVRLECLGLYVQMDELLFHCIDGCRLLSSVLQLRVYQLVVGVGAKDCAAVIQLRRYFDEPVGFACNAKATNQSDATEGLQGSRQWEVGFRFKM